MAMAEEYQAYLQRFDKRNPYRIKEYELPDW